jgi:hypothetical protein
VELVNAIEQSAVGALVRESLWVYPTLLTLHGVGLALLVGISCAVDVRILGFASDVPLRPMARFLPVMYLGFWLNALSGLGLLCAEASKMLRDPVFFVKMACILAGTGAIVRLNTLVFRPQDARLDRDTFHGSARALALASLAAWTLAIVTGRLTAYGFFR